MNNGTNEQLPLLPLGWAWSTLGELCDIVGGITVDAKRRDGNLIEVPYLRVANVQRSSLDLSIVKSIWVSSEQMRRLQLCPNDVLLNEGGDKDKVGRGWVWSGEIEPCIHQNHVFRARPLIDGMDGRWISAYSNELGRRYLFEQTKQTTNLASISLSKIRDLPIPVAPLAEQRRIWRKVEELFGEIEAGEQELQKAREGLETYRRAVLKAAVTGALTKSWRDKNVSNETGADLLASIRDEVCKTPQYAAWGRRRADRVPLTKAALPAIPSGWSWIRLVDLVIGAPRNGLSVKGSPKPPGTPALRLDALTDRGIDYTKVRYIEIDRSKAQRLLLRERDFLVSRANGSERLVGRARLVRSPPIACVYPDTIIRYPLGGPAILGDWLELAWESPFIRSQIRKRAKTTAGILKISQEDIDQIAVPLPPLTEMKELVETCGELIQEAMNLESMLLGGRSDSVALRQSILSTAFSGKLVPQNRNDEPAPELLARLRTADVPGSRTSITRQRRQRVDGRTKPGRDGAGQAVPLSPTAATTEPAQ
jgi:type I restriction enzyme, S subunit